MFTDINITGDRPAYLQIKDYIKEMVLNGMLQRGVKLPSTREMSKLMESSRIGMTSYFSLFRFLHISSPDFKDISLSEDIPPIITPIFILIPPIAYYFSNNFNSFYNTFIIQT